MSKPSPIKRAAIDLLSELQPHQQGPASSSSRAHFCSTKSQYRRYPLKRLLTPLQVRDDRNFDRRWVRKHGADS